MYNDRFNAEQHLKLNYGDFQSPVSYLGISNIYRFYNRKLSKKQIIDILSQSETYTLMKRGKISKIFTPTISYFPHELFQADLVFVDRLASENDGVKYLLCVIDCYTR